jgi:hypothetical protein
MVNTGFVGMIERGPGENLMKRNTVRVNRLIAALWDVDPMDLRRSGWPCSDEYSPEALDIAEKRGGKALKRVVKEVWAQWMGGLVLPPAKVLEIVRALQTPRALRFGIRSSRRKPRPKPMARGKALRQRVPVFWV